MKTSYYILNTKTDQSFDTMEMRFYSNNWNPEMEENKEYLQRLIDDYPERFENCIIASR